MFSGEKRNIMLVIVRGLPGSGKSTFAEKLGVGFQHYEADMFFMVKGKYHFISELLPCAHKWCQEQARKDLEMGLHVSVANTFTMLWEMQPYLDMAKALSCWMDVVKCTGNFKNSHGVPDSVIEKMKERWEDFEGEVEV